jgi:hypothetical protein
MSNAARPLVLVSWDGACEPLAMIHLDAVPQFDWILFDYTGRNASGPAEMRGQALVLLSGQTECKGEIYQALAAHLAAQDLTPEYVSLIDDDVVLGISDINRALHLARCTGLDVFSPSLSHDSEYTHRWSLQQGQRLSRPVDWVEVMMPFYRGEIFRAGQAHYTGNVSSWGIDKYLMPTLQQLLGKTRTALLDAVAATHNRPITSGNKVYRNGRNAGEESMLMKALCERLIAQQRPDLVSSDWYRRIFTQRHARTRWQQAKYRIGRPLRRWLEEST